MSLDAIHPVMRSAPSQVRVRVRARVAQALAISVLAGVVFGQLALTASPSRITRLGGNGQVFDDRFELVFRGLGNFHAPRLMATVLRC